MKNYIVTMTRMKDIYQSWFLQHIENKISDIDKLTLEKEISIEELGLALKGTKNESSLGTRHTWTR